MLLILAGAGLGYAMVHFDESPQLFWKRLLDVAEKIVRPAPVPTPTLKPTLAPTSEPTVTPTPTPGATPALTPQPTPTPVDPIAWLLDHRERAPKEVTLQRPATLSISASGKVTGSVTIPSGAKVQVWGFTLEAVNVGVENATAQLPIDATDLRVLAKAEQEKSRAEEKGKTKVAQLKADNATSAFTPPMPQVSPVKAVEFPTLRFTSPGVILTRQDLEVLKANIKREPWKSAYEGLSNNSHAKLSYKMRGPFKVVTRAPHENLNQWRQDMMAIWNLSRMWYFTGDNAYAQKAHDILLAWATTQTSFGGRESMLDLGDYAVCFVGGADILRGTWPGWTNADTAAVKKYFKDVLIPASNPFGESQFGAANKGALALCAKGLMAIFNEDTATLKTVVYQVRTLAHIGLRNSNDIGMIGDSLRDQGHFHGQMISLAMLAEALWKQGIDIYSDYDDRLLAVGEYFARVNSLTPTPFLPFGTTDSYYTADVTNHGWDHGRMALNLIYNAYVVRKGLQAPYVEMRRQQLPIDGDSFMFLKEVDHSTATPLPPLPIPATTSITSEFSNADIGGATPAGGASYSAGAWKVQGGGDMWKSNDRCHFTYKALTGNCAILAKVDSVQNTGPSARAGVMMRTSLDKDAPRAWMSISGEGDLQQNMEKLASYGGSHYASKVLAKSLPSYWVKLERIGNIITGYVSPDGANWAATDVGRIDAPLPETIYVGLVVCSGANGTLNTSTFSNVQITGGDGHAPVVTPAAPAAFLAAPGDKAVPLRWEASFGATSYMVKRATTRGGPYQVIAKVTLPSYVDTAVINGKTYYYVVTAMNSAGESANSSEESTTPVITPVNVAANGTATATASVEGTGPGKAFDGNIWTRCFNNDTGSTGWLQDDFDSGVTRTITRYSVGSAGDVPERDSKNWEFQGSNDGSTWTALDTQSNQVFSTRFEMKSFKIAHPTAYRYNRLNSTANNGAKGLHIAELGLFTDQK